jgi:fumarate hydratase class I
MRTQGVLPAFKEGFQGAPFYKLSDEGLTENRCGKKGFLKVEPEVLELLAREAFMNLAFLLPRHFLEGLSKILNDNAASDNEKFVANMIIKNAVISSEGVLPLCQDTGTATVFGFKGEQVITGGLDSQWLERGIEAAYRECFLRQSQLAALTMFEEKNTATNLPAQIDIHAADGDECYFAFIAKGGGSSNKTNLFQRSPAILNEKDLNIFLEKEIPALGVAACPPYTIGVVIGGSSPEYNLKILKLATSHFLDCLPAQGSSDGRAFRDYEWEDRILQIAKKSGLGAQFGGKYLALAARVVRLSRHAASCPISIGVSCCAHRNTRGKINKGGVFLEELEKNPVKYLNNKFAITGTGISIDFNLPINDVIERLWQVPVGSLLELNGPMLVARDAAHRRFYKMLKEKGTLPDYLRKYPIYYAGPSGTPPGNIIGSLGPTTAQRMDLYIPEFMEKGASLITIAKGNRAPIVAETCKKYGGFYIGTVGGVAALMTREYITHSEILDYADLGMEAVRLIVVSKMPAFLVIDNKGNNLYAR